MTFCIMHFASSLLRIFFKNFTSRICVWSMVLSRCCFHQLVEYSIIYKKDIQHFFIGPILFSENKIIRSVVGRKVDGHILFDARSEKPKILFGARGEKRKNLFGAKWQLRKIVFGSQRVNKDTILISTQWECWDEPGGEVMYENGLKKTGSLFQLIERVFRWTRRRGDE